MELCLIILHMSSNKCMFFFRISMFSYFLGRLQPSTTTIQKTPGTLGVDKSSYPRKVQHFYTSNSSRGRMRESYEKLQFGELRVVNTRALEDDFSKLSWEVFQPKLLLDDLCGWWCRVLADRACYEGSKFPRKSEHKSRNFKAS